MILIDLENKSLSVSNQVRTAFQSKSINYLVLII